MMNDRQFGWTIGRSILGELAFVLGRALGPRVQPVSDWPEEVQEPFSFLPSDLMTGFSESLDHRGVQDFLEIAADWAGVLLEDDYARASLAVRSLNPRMALSRRTEQLASLGIHPDSGLPPAEQLVDLETRGQTALFSSLGLAVTSGGRRGEHGNAGARLALRIIEGGDLQHGFWLAMDRLYYEFYRDFRAARLGLMALSEKEAARALGGAAKVGELPDVAWLPEQNPLRHLTGFLPAAEKLRLRVVFWVEPIGLFDSWSVTPDLLVVSIAEPGVLLQSFRAHATDLARKTGALSDPTRLIILRLIRDFGLYNAEIAAYLGVSRPTVSVHVDILREAGLISSKPEGRKLRHAAETRTIRRLLGDLEAFLDLQ